MNFLESNQSKNEEFLEEDYSKLYANNFLDSFELEFPAFISYRSSIIEGIRENALNNIGPDPENDLSASILIDEEPEAGSILNSNLEFQIGDTIIKYYDEHLQFKFFGEHSESNCLLVDQGELPSSALEGVQTITMNGPVGGGSSSSATVGDGCSVSFTFSFPDPLDPNLVKFYSTIYGNYQDIKWDFGDGNINLTQEDPTHRYLLDNIYMVKLYLSGNEWSPSSLCGQTGYAERNISIGCSPNFTATQINEKTYLIEDHSFVPGISSWTVGYDFDGNGSVDKWVQNGQSFYHAFPSYNSTYNVKQTIPSFCQAIEYTLQITTPNSGVNPGQCYGSQTHRYNPSNYGPDVKWKAVFANKNSFIFGNKIKLIVKAMRKTSAGWWILDYAPLLDFSVVGNFWIDCYPGFNPNCTVMIEENLQFTNSNTVLLNQRGKIEYIWNSNDLNNFDGTNDECPSGYPTLDKPVRLKDNSLRGDIKLVLTSQTIQHSLYLH